MPRVLAEALHSGAAADAPWDAFTYGVSHPAAIRRLRASAFMMPGGGGDEKADEAAEGSIDDPPEQQLWPMPVPKSREPDPFGRLMSFLTGHKAKDQDDSFGKAAKELAPSTRDAHEDANKADDYAVEAQEAAEDAVRWDRGVVNAVNVADQAWDGAMYASRVNKQLDTTTKELERFEAKNLQSPTPCKGGKPCSKVRAEIEEFERRAMEMIGHGDKAWELKFPLKRMVRVFQEAGTMLQPEGGVRTKGSKPLLDFLSDKDHPPLFPPEDGPGMKDGAVEVPLRFPENPEPMVMEEYTPPDVQARMPPGSLPLDMSTLKGIA